MSVLVNFLCGFAFAMVIEKNVEDFVWMVWATMFLLTFSASIVFEAIL